MFFLRTLTLALVLLMTNSCPTAGQQITKERAFEIARKQVAELSTQHDFVLMEEKTIERPFGWVFFYATRQFIQTGDRNFLVPGSAPFVVNRSDGTVEQLPTSVPPARAIELHEKRWMEKQATDRGGQK